MDVIKVFVLQKIYFHSHYLPKWATYTFRCYYCVSCSSFQNIIRFCKNKIWLLLSRGEEHSTVCSLKINLYWTICCHICVSQLLVLLIVQIFKNAFGHLHSKCWIRQFTSTDYIDWQNRPIFNSFSNATWRSVNVEFWVFGNSKNKCHECALNPMKFTNNFSKYYYSL